MIKRTRFIILGSTGRNTGKTEFACRLIEKYAKEQQLYGVKVVTIDPDRGACPRGGEGCGVCTSLQGDYEISEETRHDTDKDTSRMLRAGAHKVYFLKVRYDRLEKGLKALLAIIPEKALTVCESNSIRKVIEPGLFLVIKNKEEKQVKESCAEVIQYANKVIDFHKMQWNFSPERVLIQKNGWIIRENATAIILAGGKSSRMGVDKSLLSVNGEPMIAGIVRQLEDYFDEVIISANDPGKYAFLKRAVVPDVEKNRGPLMGIYSCLMASNSEVNFITACDIPEMNLRLIQNMINLTRDTDIVMPIKEGGRHEPLYAIYRKSVAGKAEWVLNNNGERIIELLDHVRVKLIAFNDTGWYQNLNLKDDYYTYVKKSKLRKCHRAQSAIC
jgi:molybdopterin-guanine dinucleotide biosynthesis protein A